MEINSQLLQPYLLFDKKICYNEKISLYPVRMKDIVSFQQYQDALLLRKNSIFKEKEIIKMEYWEFIKYAYGNDDLSLMYNMPNLKLYYEFIMRLLTIICANSEIKFNNETLDVFINGELITNEIFDNLRRIIIIQNGVDFDIDEFMNIDTVNALEKARNFEAKKNKENADIEDYIDSLLIDLKVTEDYVSNLTIRKFWRYIKRINKHEDYQSCYSAQLSGMVTFKEPLKHWMTSIEVSDKYESLKTNEGELRSKIG